MGIQQGAEFGIADDPSALSDLSSLLGYRDFGVSQLNQDILAEAGLVTSPSAGSSGFATPLPSGSYTFLLRQAGPTTGSTINLQWSVNVSRVSP